MYKYLAHELTLTLYTISYHIYYVAEEAVQTTLCIPCHAVPAVSRDPFPLRATVCAKSGEVVVFDT